MNLSRYAAGGNRTGRVTITASGGGGGGGNVNTGDGGGSYLGSGGTTYYISPTGNNANDGLSSGAPKKTFANAFAAMSSGDMLLLMDGTYSVAAGTGIINWQGTGSGQPPGGISVARSTRVKAVNRNQAIVAGDATNGAGVFHGRSFRADDYVEYHGIKFTDGGVAGNSAGSLFNGNYCTFKNCAFNGAFGVGTSDHSMNCTYNLIEDCWVWAYQARVIVINYRADFNIWRRVVFRGDGCNTGACTGSGTPNVGFSVYESTDCTLMNVFGIDRVLHASAVSTGNAYADFATAQHTSGQDEGRNKWLGCMSINPPDSGTNFEADATVGSPTWTINNFVVVTTGTNGVNNGASGTVVINGVTAVNSSQTGDGIRVAPTPSGTSVTNVLVRGFSRGLNSSLTPQYTSVYGATTAYNQTTPTVGVHTANQYSDGTPTSLKYPVRIETGSALSGAGSSGADIGATVMYCIGEDGTRYGDSGVETVTSIRLWPYPNEALIKADFATGTNGTRGFCTGTSLDGSSQTLTKYVWESLGNQIPGSYY